MGNVVVKGFVHGYDGQNLTIVAPFKQDWLLMKRCVNECEIRLNDGRTISADQRKKIYATMRDISEYTGHTPDQIKALMKYDFIARTGCDYFSLSNVDMTTANEFLNFLIEFCLENDIPTLDSLLERSPDTARYIYACIANKKCCITQKKCQIHHVDAVGQGRNRKDIIHKGMHVLPLFWKLHKEAHDIGKQSFCEKYHVFGIKLDDYLCEIWKVRSK